MTELVINRETLTAALEASVAERGENFVYPDEWRGGGVDGNTCKYVLEDGTPACIFGMALTKLGVPAERLKDRFTGIINILEELGVQDWKLSRASVEAQSRQDNGNVWRDALYAWNRSLADSDEEEEGYKF